MRRAPAASPPTASSTRWCGRWPWRRERAAMLGFARGDDGSVTGAAPAEGGALLHVDLSRLLAGRHASRLRGRGLNFEELRHYVQGDDTRTIDWRATARLGSPHVRVYTE